MQNVFHRITQTNTKLLRQDRPGLDLRISAGHSHFRLMNYHNELSMYVEVNEWQTCCCKLPWGTMHIQCMSSCESTSLLSESFTAMCNPRRSFSCSIWGRRLHSENTRSNNQFKWYHRLCDSPLLSTHFLSTEHFSYKWTSIVTSASVSIRVNIETILWWDHIHCNTCQHTDDLVTTQ